jgi:hypothetical protein
MTAIELTGQDGSSTTNGAGHKLNIYGSWNALGINDANVSGNEYGNFDPNEAMVVTCDVDIVMVEIDLASTTDGSTEMTLSSPAFDDILLLGNGEGGGTFSLSNTFVAAGTPITFQNTTPTNAVDTTVRISYLTLDDPAAAVQYAAWVQEAGLVSTIDDYGDDWDNDNFDNFSEWVLGGDPLVADAEVMTPTWGISEDGGIPYLNYIYRRRIQYALIGLNYSVDSGTELATGLTDATEEAGSGAVDADIETVTNRVSTEVEAAQFMQLNVTLD